MDFLKALTERGQAALKYVMRGAEPAEFFKSVTDEGVGKVIVGLLDKAGEWSGRIDELEKQLTDTKEALAKTAPDSESALDAVLKGVTDPNVRSLIETQRAAVRKQGGEIAELHKAARQRDLNELVKSYANLPSDGMVDVLLKADDAGILDGLKKLLEAANAAAKLGKAYEELGIETVAGDGSALDHAEAHEALVAKAVEIRKTTPTLSAEQAYEIAAEAHPDLYQATRHLRVVEG